MTDSAIAVVCPKCGYARTAADTAPAWQCPACGIAYQKYSAYLEHARKAVTPLRADDTPPHFALDGSVWSLVAANVLTLCIARWQHWSTPSLMLIYWSQSVIIGIANVFRMLALERFSTENFTMNGKSVDPTPATKWRVAGFFALHYGIFHFVYLQFLATNFRHEQPFTRGFWICVAAFALNHLWSFPYNRQIDHQGTPNIGTLMMTPYVRIVPMHLTLIFGGITGGSLLLFGTLKTVADVTMHVIEHGQLKKVREPPAMKAD